MMNDWEMDVTSFRCRLTLERGCKLPFGGRSCLCEDGDETRRLILERRITVTDPNKCDYFIVLSSALQERRQSENPFPWRE